VGAARKVSASVRRAHIRDTCAASAPDREPGRILIPGDGAAGDQRAQHRPACPAMAATRRQRACPVSTTSWRHGLRRTCRLVTGRSQRSRSTWPNQARLAFLAVTHRYKRAHCLWPEQFQIDAPMFVKAFFRPEIQLVRCLLRVGQDREGPLLAEGRLLSGHGVQRSWERARGGRRIVRKPAVAAAESRARPPREL
jgi:hypothetical protein